MATVAFCPPQFVRMAWLAVQQEVPNIPNAKLWTCELLWPDLDEQPIQLPPVELLWLHRAPHKQGWHSRLRKVVGKAHPNVYELVDVIKREEATSKLKLQQYESGAVLPARRRKVKERERRLTTLFDRFNKSWSRDTESADQLLRVEKLVGGVLNLERFLFEHVATVILYRNDGNTSIELLLDVRLFICL